MPAEYLINFVIVIFTQLLFFFFHAYKVGELHNVKRHLLEGAAIGLPFGIIFDLIIGRSVGFFDYTFGYTWWFLIINGIFSYGFMVANVYLLRRSSLKQLYLWSIALAAVYEATNFLFPVWEWTFWTSGLEYLTVIFAAYFGLAVLMIGTIQVFYRFRLNEWTKI